MTDSAAFHYAVKVKMIRYETKDNIDFIVEEKYFKNEIPIIAREEAFREYDAWINDLYTGLGKPGQYKSDRQARIDLHKFITPSEKFKVLLNDHELLFGNTYGFGIGVYIIIDQPYNTPGFNESMQDKPGEQFLLHGIGYSGRYSDPLEISGALHTEILYYEHYNYEKLSFERRVNFYDYEIDDVEEIRFLETPFDWSGLDVRPPDSHENKAKKAANKILDLIAGGEGNNVEFKPALLYNFKTKSAGISVKGIIAKAICSFLNSNGGFLFIGLNDDGRPQGLEWDFSLANGKKPKDFFRNEFDQMIEHFLGFSVVSNIDSDFYEIDGKDVFIAFVAPSKKRPVFLNTREGKEFWVRGNAGNRQLSNIEELVNYCIDKWSKGDVN